MTFRESGPERKEPPTQRGEFYWTAIRPTPDRILRHSLALRMRVPVLGVAQNSRVLRAGILVHNREGRRFEHASQHASLLGQNAPPSHPRLIPLNRLPVLGNAVSATWEGASHRP